MNMVSLKPAWATQKDHVSKRKTREWNHIIPLIISYWRLTMYHRPCSLS